jgi:uncharacterized membrane protein
MKTSKILNSSIAGFLLAALALALRPGQSVLAADPSSKYCQKVNNSTQLQQCVQHNQIIKDLQAIINALSAGVAIIVVIMITVGGIQYMTAGGSPEAVTKAKQRITNALLALLAFLLTFAFLQWLIPGGIFG